MGSGGGETGDLARGARRGTRTRDVGNAASIVIERPREGRAVHRVHGTVSLMLTGFVSDGEQLLLYVLSAERPNVQHRAQSRSLTRAAEQMPVRLMQMNDDGDDSREAWMILMPTTRLVHVQSCIKAIVLRRIMHAHLLAHTQKEAHAYTPKTA